MFTYDGRSLNADITGSLAKALQLREKSASIQQQRSLAEALSQVFGGQQGSAVPEITPGQGGAMTPMQGPMPPNRQGMNIEALNRLRQLNPDVALKVEEMFARDDAARIAKVKAAAENRARLAMSIGSRPYEDRLPLIDDQIREAIKAGDEQMAQGLMELRNMDEADQTIALRDHVRQAQPIADAIAGYEAQFAAPDYKDIRIGEDGRAYGVNSQTGKFELVPAPDGVRFRDSSPSIEVTNEMPGPAADSIAKQVGPILDENRVKASGAIKLYRDAKSILNALNDGDVFAGPGATFRQRVAQIGSVLGFEGDKRILRTRQIVKALASSAVEARKELAGQGQVTENEAKAVEKAMSGNIDDMTMEELRLLANVNIKSAKVTANQYMDLLKAIPADDAGLQAIKPFYQIRGLDKILEDKESDKTEGSAKLDNGTRTGSRSAARSGQRKQKTVTWDEYQP